MQRINVRKVRVKSRSVTPNLGFLAIAGVTTQSSKKAPVRTAPIDDGRRKKVALMDAKIAKMQQQLAMLNRLQKERKKRLERMAREEHLHKKRMKKLARLEKQRLAQQKRAEQQQRLRLKRREQALQAKLAQAQKAHRRKWTQELLQIQQQRAQLDKEVNQKKQRLAQLRKQTKKEILLAAQRRLLNKRLIRQEKDEITALRKQRSSEKKRLARLRTLVARQKKLRREQSRLRAILAAKKARSRKQRRLRRHAQKRLARIKRESARIKKQKKKIDEKKRLAQRALQQFNKGSCSQAASYFRKAGRTELSKKLKEFETNMNMGRGAYNRRNVVVAIPLLERALTLDLEIGGGRSRFTRSIRGMLANLYMIKGRIEMTRNDYSGAFLYLRTARRYMPKHGRVQYYLKKLRNKAHHYYKLATTQYKDDVRMKRRYLQNVTRILYPHDALYKKALQELNR